MRIRLIALLAAALGLATASALRAGGDATAPYKTAADGIEKEKDQLSVKSAFVEFEGVAQLEDYFKRCYGCAIFPTIGKGGFGVGGAHGKGWVFKHRSLVGESKLTQVTLGFQVGGQAFRQIVFFEDEDAFERFSSGNFEFGAQASAAIVIEGATVSASTVGGSNASIGKAQAKSDYTDGMAVFAKIRGGLMYEAAIGGQKFSYRSLK